MAENSSQSLNIVGNINSFNVVNVNTVISDEEDKIREWLSPLKPHQRHQGVRADRLDGVGDLFLETSEFGNGVTGIANLLSECYFVPGAQVWERHICGKNTPRPEKEKKACH